MHITLYMYLLFFHDVPAKLVVSALVLRYCKQSATKSKRASIEQIIPPLHNLQKWLRHSPLNLCLEALSSQLVLPASGNLGCTNFPLLSTYLVLCREMLAYQCAAWLRMSSRNTSLATFLSDMAKSIYQVIFRDCPTLGTKIQRPQQSCDVTKWRLTCNASKMIHQMDAM